ncbi:MAG: hypothetical protein FWD52_07965 [Candidatus Bathyarchaeota archaeon]|nr:hypothetical protein [Candidatus Termiticorpusculum sp.]
MSKQITLKIEYYKSEEPETETFKIYNTEDGLVLECPLCLQPVPYEQSANCANGHIAYTIIEEDLIEKVVTKYTNNEVLKAVFKDGTVRCEKCEVEIWDGADCDCGVDGADHEEIKEAYAEKTKIENIPRREKTIAQATQCGEGTSILRFNRHISFKTPYGVDNTDRYGEYEIELNSFFTNIDLDCDENTLVSEVEDKIWDYILANEIKKEEA